MRKWEKIMPRFYRKNTKTLHATVAAVLMLWTQAILAAPVELFHIHGLSYSADGKNLYIPSHFGLAVYENGRWRKAAGPEHDYMGFTATRNALYSSGHPAPGSNLVNPFGLIKSTDQGRNWKQLGMAGEADFHVLAASYNTNAVYVHNLARNSWIAFRGLAYTLDDGASWRRARRQNAPEPLALAVHPSRPELVAIAAQEGLFLSLNRGDDFEQLAKDIMASTVWFDLNGEQLWYGGVKFTPFLARIDLKTRQQKFVKLPPLGRDAVAYIAQNPARTDEYAIATFQRNVFITHNGGTDWQLIAEQGTTR